MNRKCTRCGNDEWLLDETEAAHCTACLSPNRLAELAKRGIHGPYRLPENGTPQRVKFTGSRAERLIKEGIRAQKRLERG